MAEFAASIIGIVSAGTKIALVLSQLAADVGSAGHEARMIGGEIRSFCSVLKTLGETIETIEKSPRYTHCSDLISDMTNDSLQMFTEILNAVDNLKKMTAGRGGKDGNFGLVERVQWAVFKKPKLLVLRAGIEAYKTNLTLMLSTLSTAERAARPTSSSSDVDVRTRDKQDRSLLESLELDREATLIELAQAERHYEETTDPDSAGFSTSTLDVVLDNSPPSYDAVTADTGLREYGLMNLARNEIQSMRSSLSRKPETNDEALRKRIVRHSRRVSYMLEDDQRRLSQRWSQTLQGDLDITSNHTSSKSPGLASSQGPPRASEHDAMLELRFITNDGSTATSLDEEDMERPAFDPDGVAIYKAFVAYVSQLDGFRQQQVSRALERDIARSNRGLRQPPSHPSRISSKAESSAVGSRSTSELSTLPSPIRSMSRHLSSSRLTVSTVTSSADRRPHIARSASPRDRNATALPALQYVQPTRVGADFLSDRSRRPPGQKPSTVKSKAHGKYGPVSVETSQLEPWSPVPVVTNLFTVSTPRQEALARLTSLEQSSRPPLPPSTSLPELPSTDTTSPLPKIRISKHRRSRSEHTLVVTKSNAPLEDLSASRSRSIHDLTMKKEPTETGQPWEATSDTSGDESGNEGSLMWWRSIGNISPQPYRRPEHTLSRTTSKRRLNALEATGDPTTSPGPSGRGIAVIAHMHNGGVPIVLQSRNTCATAN